MHQYSEITLNGLGEDDNIRFHSIEGAQVSRDKTTDSFNGMNLSSCLCGISPVDPTSQLYTDIPSM